MVHDAGPDLGDFIKGTDLASGSYSVEAPSWKVRHHLSVGQRGRSNAFAHVQMRCLHV